jgi:hypothetical protein
MMEDASCRPPNNSCSGGIAAAARARHFIMDLRRAGPRNAWPLNGGVMRPSPAFRSCTRLPVWLVAISAAIAATAATPEVSQLISQFQAEPVFWRQQEIANEIATVATLGDLSVLEPWLDHRDRHIRGNVAYLFAQVGDKRGLATLLEILADESPDRKVEWQGISFSYTGNADEAMAKFLRSPAALRAQIVTDRYYAVHLLGKLRDKRAVETLIPLLEDNDINYNVAWALGEIGDARAIPGLIDALGNSDALVRVSAIGALEALRAEQALPYLAALFGDSALPRAGERVPVGETARKAASVIRGTATRW